MTDKAPSREEMEALLATALRDKVGEAVKASFDAAEKMGALPNLLGVETRVDVVLEVTTKVKDNTWMDRTDLYEVEQELWDLWPHVNFDFRIRENRDPAPPPTTS